MKILSLNVIAVLFAIVSSGLPAYAQGAQDAQAVQEAQGRPETQGVEEDESHPASREIGEMFRLAGSYIEVPKKKTPSVARAAHQPAGPARNLSVRAYAYSLRGRTASGRYTEHGIVAVDPRVIPLGSKLYIPGYGWAVAADTGGAIKGNKIDLWMPTSAQCYQWGVRNVDIKVYPRSR